LSSSFGVFLLPEVLWFVFEVLVPVGSRKARLIYPYFFASLCDLNCLPRVLGPGKNIHGAGIRVRSGTNFPFARAIFQAQALVQPRPSPIIPISCNLLICNVIATVVDTPLRNAWHFVPAAAPPRSGFLLHPNNLPQRRTDWAQI